MLRLHPGVSQRLGAVLLGIAALGAWYCYMDIGTAVRVAFPLPPEVRLNAPPASTISTDRRHLAGDAASVFHSLFPAVAAGQRNASSRASAPLAVAGAPGSVQPPRPLRRTIPHTLHQSWKTAMIPSVWAPFVRSWVTLHPRWNYTFYSDDALRRFFVREMPEFLPAFDACDAICKVDFSRLGFMHSFGGVYADLDFEALRPLDALIDPPSAHEAMLAKEPELHARLLEGKDSFVCNALLVSRPGHPFWRHAMELSAARIAGGNVGYGAAGPWAIAKIWQAAPSEIRAGVEVLPEEYFYPQAALWNLPRMIKECQGQQEQEQGQEPAAGLGSEKAAACAQLETGYGASPAVQAEVMLLVRQKEAAKAELAAMEGGGAAGGSEALAGKRAEVDALRESAAKVAIDAAAAAAAASRATARPDAVGSGGGRFTERTYAQHHWHCSWCNGVRGEETVHISELVPAEMLTVY